ncbi:MAG: class I SAM-dependent methyltransferase [Salinirussus sp.]
MGFHTYDVDRADRLEEESRYEWCSAEELRSVLAPSAGEVVADLGSGTGFYTDVIAPWAGTVYAIDVQTEMHSIYGHKGVPDNVRRLTAEVADLPLATNSLDAAYSTMTYHEYATEEAHSELARVLRPGGRLVTVDWSRHGDRPDGPPLDQRYDLGHCIAATEAVGFTIDRAVSRTETFLCRAIR